MHSASSSFTVFRPGCHDPLLECAPSAFGLGDRTSVESRGVEFANADGETLMPFCMNGFVGDGDLEDILGDDCVISAGVDGLVKPLRRPRPPGRFRDWSRSMPFVAFLNIMFLISGEPNGGVADFISASLVV